MDELITRPKPQQANRAYLLLLTLLLAGGIFLMPHIGIGANLWVNELVYMLLIPLILAFRSKWPIKETFRLKAVSPRLPVISMIIGMLFWLPAIVLYNTFEYLTGLFLGPSPDVGAAYTQLPAIQIIMVLIGMVVLAPVCEEIFFRGFMQRAYEDLGIKQSWIITGILFGAMHILNGMNNLIPTTLLGLAMGFLTNRTGSIWPAMALHCGANLMSQIGAALLPAVATPQILPLWIYGIAILSALIGLVLLVAIGRRGVQETVKDAPAQAMQTPAATPVGTLAPAPELASAPAEALRSNMRKSSSLKSLFRSNALLFAALILLFTIGAEVAIRLEAFPRISELSKDIDTVSNIISQTKTQPQEANISAGEFSNGITLFSVEVEHEDVGKELLFRYDMKVAELNQGAFRLMNPTGTVVWEEKVQGAGLTAQSGFRHIALDQSGQWQLRLHGSGRELKIKTVWRIQ